MFYILLVNTHDGHQLLYYTKTNYYTTPHHTTPQVDSQMQQSRMANKPKTKEEMEKSAVPDPLFVCTAFKKSR